MAGVHRNWRAMLRSGLEAVDFDPADEAAIEARMRTGRPLGGARFIEDRERRIGRKLARAKPGPKPRVK